MSKARVNTVGGVVTEIVAYEQEGSERAALCTILTLEGFTQRWIDLRDIELA